MPNAPPSMAPMNRDGLNTPPPNPPPSEIAVAAVLKITSRTSSWSGIISLSAASVEP